VPFAGWTYFDSDCRKKLGRPGLVQNSSEVGFVLEAKLSADQSLENRRSGVGRKKPCGPLDEVGVQTGFGRCRLHLGKGKAVWRMAE
jgi:hypothetical protein